MTSPTSSTPLPPSAVSPAATIRPRNLGDPEQAAASTSSTSDEPPTPTQPHQQQHRGSTGSAWSPGSLPTTPLSPYSAAGVGIPGRSGSIASTDDDYATPRNTSYFPTESRRVSEVRGTTPRGGQQGSSGRLPSPGITAHTGSSSYGRSSRPRAALGSMAEGASAEPRPSISRSASRVRLPIPQKKEAKDGYAEDDEDDEAHIVDRGEDLIRRRLKERKRAKKEKERERERRLAAEELEAPEGEEELPSQPTSAATDSFHTAPIRAAALSPARDPRQRTVSRTRYPSGRHYSAPGRARSESVDEVSQRDRADSVQSVADDDEIDEQVPVPPPIEEGEDEDDIHEDGTVDEEEGDEPEEEDEDSPGDEEGVTLKDRQDAINIEHPFGLPIWKPALYRKSRSVTRNAESALHSIPSAAAERHLLLGNLLWTVLFGWWLGLIFAVVAFIVSIAEFLAGGRGGYAETLRGLAWYITWPFGKYVEGEGAPPELVDDDKDDTTHHDEENNGGSYGTIAPTPQRTLTTSTSSSTTIKPLSVTGLSNLPDEPAGSSRRETRHAAVSFAPGVKSPTPSPVPEETPLLKGQSCFRKHLNRRAKFIGSLLYWPLFLFVVGPLMLIVCLICWSLVITIPMAKLTWELLNLLWNRPLEINFRAAPKVAVPAEVPGDQSDGRSSSTSTDSPSVVLKRQRLHAGQIAPTSGPTSTVLLCTYRAVGLQYYKYTVGGVNIMFINLLPLVFFTIIDGIIILPAVEKRHEKGLPVSPFFNLIASQALIFVLGLASVIPLSYFIGMAVASISAQSSIGMGAVINATFGSIIEIVLYGIALTQGKGRLVEGSIVGSILAGVLLMPGASMCSGAFKRKEQKFNAKSAGVTSTMLIMAIIGTLTPTMFYQTYGSFQLHCNGCPPPGEGGPLTPEEVWNCNHCYYEHPDPVTDPFYQDQVKQLMYACAAILLLSYLIGLWFSLRTHASQIWQNPQKVMVKEDLPVAQRAAIARITPAALNNPILPVHNNRPGSIRDGQTPRRGQSPRRTSGGSPLNSRRELGTPGQTETQVGPHTGYTPFLESLERGKPPNIDSLPPTLTSEDFRRAVHTLATVSALHQQQRKEQHQQQQVVAEEEEEEHGGHEAPSWTRGVSAAVLLGCTVLYAIIAEVLVDVVDVVLKGSGIDEKFLGLTLFALVPNTTEFMNAMSFAMNGNIALSMEIGSAYALQVCLLQIPAMVAFSAFYNPTKLGDQIDTFTLIFPRWDVIAIILSIFLLTYTYIEARSNYHRGSILILAYIVLVLGFYYAPNPTENDTETGVIVGPDMVSNVVSSLSLSMTKLWT